MNPSRSFFMLGSLLLASNVYARDAAIPSDVCSDILKREKPAAFLVHRGQLWNEAKPIDLGELESIPHVNEIMAPGEFSLVVVPAKYSAFAIAGNSLKVNLTEVSPSCGKTRQYKIGWTIYPKNVGSGRFEDQFDLSFDGPGNYGYPPVVKTTFNTSVTALVHGPRTALDVDKKVVREFFLGARETLSLAIRNSGDRTLTMEKLISNTQDGHKEIEVRSTTCPNKAIPPNSSCSIELERSQRSSRSTAPPRYSLSFSSNEVGTSNTEIHLDYTEKSGVQAYIQRWE